MKRLQPDETELIGQWVLENNEIHPDATCERINWLVANLLVKVGYSKAYGAWETLYRDMSDGRYWVKTYPQGHMHGGGPPTLKYVPERIAREEYDIVS